LKAREAHEAPAFCKSERELYSYIEIGAEHLQDRIKKQGKCLCVPCNLGICMSFALVEAKHCLGPWFENKKPYKRKGWQRK